MHDPPHDNVAQRHVHGPLKSDNCQLKVDFVTLGHFVSHAQNLFFIFPSLLCSFKNSQEGEGFLGVRIASASIVRSDDSGREHVPTLRGSFQDQ